MKIFRSIRGKVMAISVAVSAAAMVAITLAVTLATGWAIGATIENSLDQRLDEIEEQLAAGEMPQELRGTGADLVQIIDDTGAVVASSDWATDVGPISEGGLVAGEERREERDRVSLHIDVADEADDTEEPAPEPAPATGAPASPAAPAASSGYDGGSGYDGSIRSRFAATTRVFARSGLLDADLADLPVTVEGVNLDASSVMGTEGPFVVVERGVQTPDGVVTIAAMTSLAFAREAMATVALILAAVMLVALIAVAGLSWLMVARTLAPVERMRLEAEGISISDLGRRLPVPEQDRDLGGLATTFNDMLSRLEAAVAEQRRFVSDASHELKSPVAAIRVMLETMRDHPDAVDADTLSRDLLSENDRLGGIVGNLLLLARQDEGVSRLDKQQLDLCDLLFEEATALKARTSCEVDAAGVEPVVCTADHEAISHAVRNVLDNAARYAKGKVALACRLAEDAGKEYVEIVVSDDGPGIAPKDRERVFGRFVRLEEGRSRKTGSTGLGLSVVRTIARQHGGDAFFTEPELGGATVVIRIEA